MGTVWPKTSTEGNGYARPVQGMVPIIDVHSMEMLAVEDHSIVPLSTEAFPLEPGTWGPDREGSDRWTSFNPRDPASRIERQFDDPDDEIVWAIEDRRHLFRRLERDLRSAGHRIVRVPPK